MKWVLAIAVLIIVTVGALLFLAQKANAPSATEPSNFAQCAAAGYPVMESYPRQCNTPQGGHFVEDVQPPGIADLITVDSPHSGATVSSPLTITGAARGTWYFEASFPLELKDAGGNTIAQGPAQAQGDWMTEDFVPFSATLTFPPQPAGSQGTIVVHNDNPSGEPQNEKSFEIPVVF